MHGNTIHLDLTGCRTALEFHLRIKNAFDFPDWYGCNWSAFYDLMTTEVDASRVVISGVYTLPESLQDYAQIMHTVLDDLVVYHRDVFNEVFTYEVLN